MDKCVQPSNLTGQNTDVTRWQLPVLSAFALMIHKVQGLSLPSITLALNKSIFSEGQAYVGLSRATTLEQVFLTQLDFDAIKADPGAIAEYNRLRAVATLLET
jgi:ATP-dependent DNA helicase PIF1